MSADVSVSRDVAASADAVWKMVADLPRMGEWSPENEGGAWIKGATGPAPGAAFQGSNRHGGKSWKTVAKVVDAEPGRRFSFRVTAMGLPVALWAYDITSTEQWMHGHRELDRSATGILQADRREGDRRVRPGRPQPVDDGADARQLAAAAESSD
jgi:hypothetical protein